MRLRVVVIVILAAALAGFASTQDLHELAASLPLDVEQVKLGLQVWQWLALAALLVGSAIVGYAVTACFGSIAKIRERLGGPQASSSAKRGVRRAAGLLAGVLFWHPALPGVGLLGSWDRWSTAAIQGVTVAAAVWLVYSVWDGLCDAMTEKAAALDHRAEKLLVPLTRKLVRFLIVLSGSLIGMAWMGANVAGVLAGLGIGGLAVALAAKDSVENIFGSLTILFDMPFAIGDWVKIGTADGVVEEINLRSTRIRTFQDSLITLPNSHLITASVENYGARRFRRVRVQLAAPLDTPGDALDSFCRDLKAFVAERPRSRPDSTHVAVHDVSDAGLLILVQFFVECQSYEEELEERSAILRKTAELGSKCGLKAAAAPAG